MLPPGVVYGVASSSSWSKSICNLNPCITRIRGSLEEYCLLSKVNTLNGRGQAGLHLSPPRRQAPWFPRGWLEISGSLEHPDYDWVDNRWVRCTRNQVLGRSPIWALIRVKALVLSHSWQIHTSSHNTGLYVQYLQSLVLITGWLWWKVLLSDWEPCISWIAKRRSWNKVSFQPQIWYVHGYVNYNSPLYHFI